MTLEVMPSPVWTSLVSCDLWLFRVLTPRISYASLLQKRFTRLQNIIELLQRVSDKYCPTGCDQQEDLATLGSMQLRQTLVLWTLALRLPGERPLLETNGNILWTQQRSSGVRVKEEENVMFTTLVTDEWMDRPRALCLHLPVWSGGELHLPVWPCGET